MINFRLLFFFLLDVSFLAVAFWYNPLFALLTYTVGILILFLGMTFANPGKPVFNLLASSGWILLGLVNVFILRAKKVVK